MHIDTTKMKYAKAESYLFECKGKFPEKIKQIYPHTLVMIQEQDHIK